MGAKTAILACADGSVAEVLRRTEEGPAGAAAALVRRALPGRGVEPDGEEPWDLAEAVYPPKGTACALAVPGLDLVCDQRLMPARPSLLPAHLVAAGAGRRLYLHAMHSVVDWLAFAVWDDTRLVRSLSVAPDGGIIEDVGERLPFEAAYWAGAHPVDDDDDDDPYPLAFHPLELGERAMVELFGFYAEGLLPGTDAPQDTVDPWAVRLHGFRVS